MRKVMVANGKKMSWSAMAKGFKWSMRGYEFEANMLLMPLRGCELILGMESLNAMGVIRWNFPNRTMEFQWGGETLILSAKDTV